jgi:hypothetical protein
MYKRPWGEKDFLCILSGEDDELSRFQWWKDGKPMHPRKLKRTVPDGQEPWVWLKSHAEVYDLANRPKRTMTEEFFNAHLLT